MHVAIPIYDGFTALDAIGPAEVLGNVPGTRLTFTAARAGTVRTDTEGGPLFQVEEPLDDVGEPDVVVVPGGLGTRALLDGDPLLDWLRAVHPKTRYTTSVCTGSLLLAAAGLLDGVDAATHWASRDRLASLGANPVAERVVERGRIITAGGVSSGIDMALTLVHRLHGPELAQALQLGIEYDPAPPFDAGSPERAPAEIVEAVRTVMEQAEAEVLAKR